MRPARHFAFAALLLAALALVAPRAAVAQPAVGEHRTPAGIAFRHLAVADTHHALAFAWSDGYALTQPGKAGLAMLGPRLLLEGSRGVGESDRIEQLKDLQASLGLSGSAHFTRGVLAAPRPKFAEAAGLLADLLADPALPADRLAHAKKSFAISSRQSQENAETLASRLFSRLLLGRDGPEGNLQRLVVGDPAAHEAVEVADVEAWRRAVLGRERLTIVSAGPMSADEVAGEIDRIFAKLPGVGHDIGPAPKLRASGKLIVLERAVVQTAIVAGGPMASARERDVLPGSLAVRVLGGGFESRLTKAVREGLGATYGIRAGLQQLHPEASALVISTAVDNAKAAAALAAIRKEYARWREEGVTAAEIEPLKTRFTTEMRESLRRAPGAAQRVRDFVLVGLPVDYLAGYETRLRALTDGAVSDWLRAHFPKEPLTIVVVAPSAEGLGADCVIKSADEIARCE